MPCGIRPSWRISCRWRAHRSRNSRLARPCIEAVDFRPRASEDPMQRFNLQTHFPSMQPLLALSQQIHEAGRLEPALIELVLMRVSQINGCAYCLDMHSKDARAAGETEQRLYVLPAWRETRLFNERERIALHWAEELTELATREAVPDALYQQAREHFEE